MGVFFMNITPKINNLAIIQYQLTDGSIKVLAFSSYDKNNLNKRVGIYIGRRKVLSVQFYYNISTSQIKNLKEGVILK